MARRRRRRKLNVKMAIVLAVVVGALVALYVSYRWYRNYRFGQYPQVFQTAQRLAGEGKYDAAQNNFNRAIAFASQKQDLEASFEYRLAVAQFLMDWYRTDRSLTEEKRMSLLLHRRARLAEAANMKPENPEALRGRAESFWDTAEVMGLTGWEELVGAAEASLALRPDDAEMHRWAGTAHMVLSAVKQEHIEPALREMALAAEQAADPVADIMQWAEFLEQQQRREEALKVIRRGCQLKGDSAQLQAAAARLVLLLEQDRNAAAQHIAAAQAAPVKTAEDWVAIGRYHLLRLADPRSSDERATLKDADVDQATAAFEQAVAADPNDAIVYVQLADLHRANVRLDKSEEVLRAGWQAFEKRRGGQALAEMGLRQRRAYQSSIIQLRASLVGIMLMRREEYDLQKEWPAKLVEAREHVAFVTEQITALQGNPYLPLKLQGLLVLTEADTDEKLVEAERLFRKAYDQLAVQQSFDHETAFYLIGIYQRLGQHGEARALVDKLLTVFPDNVPFLISAARMDVHFGEFQRAEGYLRRIRQLEGQLTAEQRLELARLERDAARAMGRQTGEMAIPPQISEAMIQPLLNEARSLHARRENERAVAIVQAILQQHPAHEHARLLRAAIHLVDNDIEAAKAVLSEGLALAPQSGLLKYQLDLLSTNNPEDREKLYLEYVEQTFQGAAKHLELAKHFEQQGKGDQAAAELEQAVQADPSASTPVRLLFATYLLKKDHAKAQALIDQSQQFGLDEVDLMRATLLHAQSKRDEAVALIQQLLERRETFSEAHALLGQMYLEASDLENGRKQLTRAYELNPSSPAALISLARLAQRENRADAHEKWVNLAYRYAPNNPYVRNNWVAYRERHAQTPEHVAEVTRYCEFQRQRDPGDKENLLRLARLYMRVEPPRRDEAGQIYRDLYRAEQGQEDGLVLLDLYLNYLRQVGQVDEANRVLEDAAAVETDQVGYFVVYGRHLIVIGKLDEAVQAFDTAIRRAPADRRGHQVKALLLAERRDWAGATAALQDALKQIPDDRELRVLLITVLFRAERFEQARQVAADMAKANPADLGALVLQGRALQLAGRAEEARVLYDQVLKANPASTEALRFRSLTYVAQGDFDAAVADLRELHRLGPDPVVIAEVAKIQVAAKELDAARITLEEALNVHSDAENLLQALARVHLARGDFEAALAVLRRAQAAHPTRAAWWQEEANVWRQRKEFGRQADALQKALELESGNPEILRDYVDALADAKREAELTQLAQSIQNPPPSVAAVLLVSMGRVNLAAGNEAQAMQLFRQAFLISGATEVGLVESRVRAALGDRYVATLQQWLSEQESWSMRLSLARTLRESPDTRAQAADVLAACDLSAAGPIDRVLVRQDHGYILQELQRYDQARQAYETALAEPNVTVPSLRATTLNNLAYLLAENLNQPQAAVEYARQAVQLMPQDDAIADTLAWAHFHAGQLDLAEHQLWRAIELNATAGYRYHLGRVLEAKGRKDDALRQYQLGFETVVGSPQSEYYNRLKERVETLTR